MSAGQTFRWAVIGTGAVSAKFVHGLAALEGRASVRRVLARRAESARAFATAFALPEARAGVTPEALDGVDAVYVASPVSDHAAHALSAIAAGKPVLVEKPFAMTAEEAARVADAARAAGVFCMEALWTRFLPLIAEVRALIAAGALGQITGFDGAFQIATRPDPAASLFDPARGGGALMQRGVYPLSLARHLLGPVTDLQAAGRIGASGVDEECALLLTHASGAVSTLRASLVAEGPNGMVITGTKASLVIDPPIWRPTRARLVPVRPGAAGGFAPKGGRMAGLREKGPVQRLLQDLAPLKARVTGRAGQGLHAGFAGNGYGHEAAEVMACVAAGQTESALMPLAESLEIMGLIDRARAQMQKGGRA